MKRVHDVYFTPEQGQEQCRFYVEQPDPLLALEEGKRILKAKYGYLKATKVNVRSRIQKELTDYTLKQLKTMLEGVELRQRWYTDMTDDHSVWRRETDENNQRIYEIKQAIKQKESS